MLHKCPTTCDHETFCSSFADAAAQAPVELHHDEGGLLCRGRVL